MDNYRKRRRIALRGVATDVLPEVPAKEPEPDSLPSFDKLVAALPESQREVLIMLKVKGLGVEETARATSSTVGAVKQKANRAYERLQSLLRRQPRTRMARAKA